MRGTLEDFLDSPEGADGLLSHARKLIRLERFYRDIAPAYLSETSRLSNYKSGVVIIHTENGAAAAKLRQLTPRLIDGFSQCGVDCHGVEIKVRGSKMPSETLRQKNLKPLSAQTFQALGDLRDSLSDPKLRQALERLIQRSS